MPDNTAGAAFGVGAPSDGGQAPTNSSAGSDNGTGGSPGFTVGSGQGSSGNTQGQGSPNGGDWRSALPAQLQQLASTKGWNSLEQALTSYQQLETRLGQQGSGKAPKYTAADYDFGQIANLPQGLNYNTDFADNFKGWASKAGIAPEAAKAVHDGFLQFAAQQHQTTAQAQAEARSTAIANAERSLRGDHKWGEPGTPAFTRNLELAQRSARILGITDDLKAAGVLVDNNGKMTVANANIIAALAKVGNELYAEDAVHGGNQDGMNPFDPKNAGRPDIMEMQSALIRQDPDRAISLIYASGQTEQWAALLNDLKRNRR